jgi:hypothetical protein
MELAKTEAMLFKGGSGSGTNLSTDPLLSARSSAAAAPPSGPVSSCAASTPSPA